MNTPALKLAATPYAERRFGAFLFDMDGTLITSIESANRAWTSWSKLRGFDPAHVISIMHGVRTTETIARLGVPEAPWIVDTASQCTPRSINHSEEARVSGATEGPRQ